MTCLNTHNFAKTFSVCTLVTDISEYQEMVQSFKNAGFSDENSEFLYIDNSKGNSYDGYGGLNRFLNTASGRYIIICHQDILLNYDDKEKLLTLIQEMERHDPDWAVLGNAGFNGFTEKYYRISDPWGEDTHIGQLPAKVKSLDENFLVVKNEANLALSHDLNGFHMYGADLCTIASILGWNAYVIDFHLYHKSAGNCNQSFAQGRQNFINKYTKILSSIYLRTTCTTMIITRNSLVNWIINRKLVFSIRKRWEKIQSRLKRQ